MKFLVLFFFLAYFSYASKLHEAVLKMDSTLLSQVLKTTSDVNRFSEGKTALMLAVEHEKLKIVEELLKASANVNIGRPSPLRIAFSKDNSTIVKLLLQHKAKLPKSLGISNKGLIYDLLLQRRYHSVSLLLKKGYRFKQNEKLNAFSLALSYAPLTVVKQFIDHGVDLNYKDPYLDRPVDIALRLKRHDVLNELINKGADVSDGYFLEIAVANQDLHSLKTLVKAECKIDKKRQNLLLLSVKLGNVTLLKELLRAGASLDYVTSDKSTALTEAIKYEDRVIIDWILHSDIDSKTHEYAIFYAIFHDDMTTLHALADKDIGLEAYSKRYLTPLLYAYKLKKFNIAEALLAYDIDVEAKDQQGENALFKSIRFFQDTVLRKLITKAKDIDMKNRSSVSALDLSLLTANYNAFKLLLKAEAKIDAKPLIMSVTKGLERFFIKLRDNFYLPSIRDAKNNSLLHIAAANNRINILKRLVLSSFNLDMRNDRGETALHIAAKKGYKESCSILLSFDANITARDLRNSSARNIAMKYNHPKLSKWLENYQIKKEELLRIKQEAELFKDNNVSKDNNESTV